MEVTVLSVIVATVVLPLLYFAYLSMTRPKNFPPGPLGIPIFGSGHYLTKQPHLGMMDLSKTYGGICSIKLFHNNLVCVSGYDALKMALASKDICGRIPSYTNKLMRTNYGNDAGGIVLSNCSPTWSANRKMFHTTLSETGIGKSGLDEVIYQEQEYLIKRIEETSEKGGAIKSVTLFDTPVLNVFSSIVLGYRYDYDDEKMNRLIEITKFIFSISDLVTDPFFLLPNIFPGLDKVWIPESAKNLVEGNRKITQFCLEEIESHKKTLDPMSPRDFIDCYLIKIEKEKNDKNPTHTMGELALSVSDLFQAANETTTVAFDWATLFLAGNKHVQQRIYDEIMEVLGPNKHASYNDRQKFPYAEATVYEIVRFSGLSPMTIPRLCTVDTILDGYKITKGTQVFLNIYSAHFQQDKWKNANNFDPENFFEDGKFVPNDAFMAFSGGQRICPGMALAKQELFIFLIGILQRFEILPENDDTVLNYEARSGIVYRPKVQHKYRFVKRE